MPLDDGVPVCEPVPVRLPVPLDDGVPVPEPVPLADGEPVREPVSLNVAGGDAVPELVAVMLPVGVLDPVMLPVAELELLDDSEAVPERVLL